MGHEALAEKIFIALITRDPLAAQRFTEIDARLRQLAHLARHAAAVYAYPEHSLEETERLYGGARNAWDCRASEVPEIPVPRKLTGAGEPDLFAS